MTLYYKDEYARIYCSECGASLGYAWNYYGESDHICDSCYEKAPERKEE